MPDRENNIKELTDLAEFLFTEYKEAMTWQETSKWYNRFLTVNNAITLLKEQRETIKELQNAYDYLQKQFFEAQDKLLKEHEAKTIIKKWHINPLGDYSRLHCPWCNRELDMQSAKEYVACPYCGRKVKWDE